MCLVSCSTRESHPYRRGGFRVDSVCEPRPKSISGTSYNLERATARSLCEPGQDFIDELDEVWLYYPLVSLQTDVLAQVLERNEMFDQERTGFLNLLCKMCSLQRSVPKSMRVDCSYNEKTIEWRHEGRAIALREDSGRPVAIKVVRLHLTNDFEIPSNVRPLQSCWRMPLLTQPLVEVFQGNGRLEAPTAPKCSSISRCESWNPCIRNDIRVDG